MDYIIKLASWIAVILCIAAIITIVGAILIFAWPAVLVVLLIVLIVRTYRKD